jgi:hypothetical protein
MALNANSPISRKRRLRAATLALHGGESGLLRLTQSTRGGRLPSHSALNDWAQRSASSLDSDLGAFDSPPSEPFITYLLPSAALAVR